MLIIKNTSLLLNIIVILISSVAGRIELDLFKETSRIKRSLDSQNLRGKNVWKNDTVNLFKFLNGEYYGEVKIGSPAKTFRFIFDTTWSDIWLPSSHCPWTEVVCLMHNKYDSSKSSSYIPDGREISVKSNDSSFSLSGFLSTDTFHLAHVKVENQTFMEATHISLSPWFEYWADGILGLGLDTGRWFGVTPFFYNMVKQGVIEDQIFTFYMNRDQTTERAGSLILGGKSRKNVKNDTIITLENVDKALWMIKIDGIFTTQNKTTHNVTGECKAIFDSSSNTIIGPPKIIEKLNYMLNAKYIPKFNRYSVNCREYAKLPEVSFILKGNNFTIESKYYVQFLTLGNIEACFSPFVPASDPNQPYWQLGGAFMMEFYTEFDMANNVVNIGETVF